MRFSAFAAVLALPLLGQAPDAVLFKEDPKAAMLACAERARSIKPKNSRLLAEIGRVYLAAGDDFGRVPEPLRTQLGARTFVLDVALAADRKLAREDAAVVRTNLAAQGFHIQFPPPSDPAVRPDA